PTETTLDVIHECCCSRGSVILINDDRYEYGVHVASPRFCPVSNWRRVTNMADMSILPGRALRQNRRGTARAHLNGPQGRSWPPRRTRGSLGGARPRR